MENNIFQSIFKVTHSGGSGSCFYLKSRDLFVTNYHVVEGYRTVAIHDNDRNPYLAHVVVVNPLLDIALLAAEGDFAALPEIPLADDETVSVGRKIYVAGYPYGMPFTITEGSVSAPRQLMEGQYYLQTDAAVNPGNSGGPMLNDRNEVVGVTVSKFTQADNMGFGIRVETLRKLLDSLGEVDRTQFQVQCGSCDELIAEEEEFCPSCGDKLPEGAFDEREESPLCGFVESAIREMGIDPVLARDGYDSWLFHKGSSEIRIFVYDGAYLFSTSPINLLPKKEVEPVLDYMLSEDFGPYKLGIEGRQIYIAYRIHLSDITDASEEEIRRNIVNLALKAANFRNTPKRTPDETAGRAAVRPPAAGAVPRGPATGDADGMRPERRAEGSARGTESRRPAGTDAGEGGALLLGKLADGRRCRRAAAAQAPAPPARGIPHRTGGARGRFAVDRRAHRRPARSHPPR